MEKISPSFGKRKQAHAVRDASPRGFSGDQAVPAVLVVARKAFTFCVRGQAGCTPYPEALAVWILARSFLFSLSADRRSALLGPLSSERPSTEPTGDRRKCPSPGVPASRLARAADVRCSVWVSAAALLSPEADTENRTHLACAVG